MENIHAIRIFGPLGKPGCSLLHLGVLLDVPVTSMGGRHGERLTRKMNTTGLGNIFMRDSLRDGYFFTRGVSR